MRKLNIEKIKEDLRMKVGPFAEEVAPLYKQLDWTWHGGTDLPSESLIASTLHELIDGIRTTDLTSQHPGHWISSGGLTVGYEMTRKDTLLSCIETFIRFTKSEDAYYDINKYMEEI